MGDTKISWADKVWNVFTGCNKISSGCRNCYAKRLWPRVYGKTGRAFEDVKFHEDRLNLPRGWKKPARIFVNSMSDFFHESISNANRARAWEVMSDCDRHVFQILTKRADEALVFLGWMKSKGRRVNYPNIQVGVSAENQMEVGRIELLRSFETVVPWVSLEPLIGPVDISPFLDFLKWVVIGGESGPLKDPQIRPCHPKWIMDVIEDCKAAGIPVFFKQWGAWEPFSLWRLHDGRPEQTILSLDGRRLTSKEAVTEGNPFTRAIMRKVGKDAAGHEIGGETYRQYPEESLV